MLAWKYLLMSGGFAMILVALAILGYDLYADILHRRAQASRGAAMPPVRNVRLRTSIALALLAWGPILLTFSTVMTTAGTPGCM
jgi:hypothetical protein